MRILIAWADESSSNLGVRALGEGSVALLRRRWPDAETVFMNYRSRPAAIPWGTTASLLRERATGRLGMQRWLGGFDLVWDTRSGDSFADIYGLRRHTTMSMIAEFAAQAGVPHVFAPQTIGPFGTARGRLLARRNLSRATAVFARDPLSAEASARLGRPVDATATDLVFGLPQPTHTAKHDVLLNVSGLLLGGGPHVDAEQHGRDVRGVIDGLLAEGRTVTLFPHVLDSDIADNDVPASRALADEYGGRIGLLVPSDLAEAREAIAGAQLVIGARMHACLNALSVGTPAVAMAYSRKFAPLMDAIGWHRVVRLADGGDITARVLGHARSAGLADDAAAAQARGQELLATVATRLEAW